MMHLSLLLTDGLMSSACTLNDRNCQHGIGGIDGMDHVTISVGTLVIGNVHWSEESRFLLLPMDGRVRVWWHKNTAFHDSNIMDTTAFGGGGITV